MNLRSFLAASLAVVSSASWAQTANNIALPGTITATSGINVATYPTPLFSTINMYGTKPSSGIMCTFCLNTGDNVVGGGFNVYAGYNIIGASSTGNKTALLGLISVSHTTANSASAETFYTATGSQAQANVNDNGTSSIPVGNLFGANDIIVLSNGATYWKSLVGREITLSAQTGSSVAYKVGFQVILSNADTVEGSSEDVAMTFGAQAAGLVPGWKNGITFVSPKGVWPFAATATLVGTQPTNQKDANNNPVPYAAAKGVDLSAVTFSDAAFKSSGFSVSGNGDANVNSLSVPDGQKVCFTSSNRCIYHTSGALVYDTGSIPTLSISDAGVVTIAGRAVVPPTSWTPTIGADGGSLTASAYNTTYSQSNGWVQGRLTIQTGSSIGTATGCLTFSIPNTAQYSGVAYGLSSIDTKMVSGTVLSSSSTARVCLTDGTSPILPNNFYIVNFAYPVAN